MIEIEVGNIQGRIATRLHIDQVAVISSICSFAMENSEHQQNAFNRKTRGQSEWDGRVRLFHASRQTFPVGLLNRISKFFDTVGIQYYLVDRRVHMCKKFSIPCTPREIRQYQNDIAMSSIINGSGIIKAATGSGKTTMAALTTSAIGKPSVFIVHTKDLLYQAKDSFTQLHGCKIGQIGDGIVDPMNITVATVQTLAKVSGVDYTNYNYDEDYNNDENLEYKDYQRLKIKEWVRTVGIIQFDEVQRVASRTAYEVRCMFVNADNAFGYSASPWRDDGADLMIEASFGPIIHTISASELIRQGYLIRPEITINRSLSNVWSGSTYPSVYKSAIVENMFRNTQVVGDAIAHYDIGRTTLVLITQIKHGEILENMMRSMGKPVKFISGKSNMRYRKQVIDDMRNGKAPLIIASTIADVGLDVPRIDAIVEAGAGKSSVTALQRVGRGMRLFPGKDSFHYTTYRDSAPFICNHIDRKIKIWRTEEEFRIREEK